MKERNDNIPDFDDLLFESRNRDYGAYQLRKKYNSVLSGSIIISSLIGCAVVLIPFLMRPRNEQVITGGGHYVQMQMERMEPPREELYVPPPPPSEEKTAPQEIVKYVPPVVVDSVKPFDETPPVTDEVLVHSGESQAETMGTAGVGDEVLDGGDGLYSGDSFSLLEVMPTFRGGDINKFREWVQRRTNYPQEAIDAKIRGTVSLTFIVEKDGNVSNVTIIKGVHPLIDNEAVKAISESPKWSPGLQRGQPVRVRFQIALNFMY